MLAETITIGSNGSTTYAETPTFGVVKILPKWSTVQIQDAVKDFIETSHLPEGVDREGFYYQTLKCIANYSVLGGAGDLWLGTLNGSLLTYILAHVSDDIDGRLVYCVTQAWVRKDQRGERWVKDAWSKVRDRARECLCKHFTVLSSRGKDDVYCRFLGKGFHPYISILKEEL